MAIQHGVTGGRQSVGQELVWALAKQKLAGKGRGEVQETKLLSSSLISIRIYKLPHYLKTCFWFKNIISEWLMCTWTWFPLMTLVSFHLGEQTREINLFWVYAFEAIFTIIMLVYWSYDGSLIHCSCILLLWSGVTVTAVLLWTNSGSRFLFLLLFLQHIGKGRWKKFDKIASSFVFFCLR